VAQFDLSASRRGNSVGDYLALLLTPDVPESAQPLSDKLIKHPNPADRHF
jgi:hypothetical protein